MTTTNSTITGPARAGKRSPRRSNTGDPDTEGAAPEEVIEPLTLARIETLPAAEEADPTADTRVVSVRALVVSSLNVAHREPDEELVASVREHGVIQRLVVRPWVTTDAPSSLEMFEIVIGERRFKATVKADRTTCPVEVRQLTDAEAFDLANAENLQRQDLSPMQEADLCATHLERFGRDVTTIAARMNKSVRWVEQRLLLRRLPPVGKAAMHGRKMLLGVALEVAALPLAEQREEALGLVLRPNGQALMQVGEARDALSRFHLMMSAARFDLADATLVPEAGPCTTCLRRSGTQTVLSIEGIDDVDRCLDPACWGRKVEAQWKRTAAAATAKGLVVLDMKTPGREAEAARLTLARPQHRGVVNLDAPCDIAGDALVEPAFKRLEAAKEGGDAEAVAAAENDLRKAEADAEGMTWRTVLGDKAEPVVLVREVRGAREQIVELASEHVALLALRDAGLDLPPELAAKLEDAENPAETTEAAEKEPTAPAPPRKPPQWQVEARVAELLVVRVVEAVVPAAEKARAWAGPSLWGAIVRVMARSITNEEMRAICERRKWQPARSQGETVRDVFDARVARLNDGGLRGLLVELLASSGADAARALGEAFGLDVKKMTAAARKVAATSVPASGTCRMCGCDELHACKDRDGLPCSWVEPDLCSKCNGSRSAKGNGSRSAKGKTTRAGAGGGA